MFRKLLGDINQWLAGGPQDNRRAPRVLEPSILVHYWDGSVPEGRKIRDISATGAYIITNENWYPGTIVRLILRGHRAESSTDEHSVPYQTTTISSRVVRQGPDGVAVEFLFPAPGERMALEQFLATIPKTPDRPAVIGGTPAGGSP